MTESVGFPSLPDYWARVTERQADYPEWREGQTAFNVLHEMRPELANKIRGGTIDPFYRDDKLPYFVEWLEGDW